MLPASAANEPAEWTVLAHLDCRGGLTQACEGYRRQLLKAKDAGQIAIALQIISDQTEPTISRQFAPPTAPLPQPHKMAQPLPDAGVVLRTFVIQALQKLPAKHTVLLVMGHGSGLLQATGTVTGLSVAQLRDALRAARVSSGRAIDVVALDTCYAGSLEIAWELRDRCRYLTAAPGLIYSPGLDWAAALQKNRIQGKPLSLARDVVAQGQREARGRSALVALDLRGMEAVANCLQRLAVTLCSSSANLTSSITAIRAQAYSWGDRQELCDVGDIATGFARDSSDPDVRAAAQALHNELTKLVVAQWGSDRLANTTAVAVGLYFPPTLEKVPASYSEAFELGLRTGWADFLRLYWEWVADLLTGALN